jgi:hypothetical protein
VKSELCTFTSEILKDGDLPSEGFRNRHSEIFQKRDLGQKFSIHHISNPLSMSRETEIEIPKYL